jgi:hypothetical protein
VDGAADGPFGGGAGAAARPTGKNCPLQNHQKMGRTAQVSMGSAPTR